MESFKIILFIILMGICPMLHSQSTVSYGYDAAGNRTSRTIVFPLPPPPKPAPPPQEVEPPVYSEVLSDIVLNIYPNPTAGLLKVEIHNLPEGQTANILLYNLSGGLISSHKEVSDFTTVDISSQPSGTYLMKIMAGEYQTEWKIIKQ